VVLVVAHIQVLAVFGQHGGLLKFRGLGQWLLEKNGFSSGKGVVQQDRVVTIWAG